MRPRQRHESIDESAPEAGIGGLIATAKESGHVDLRSFSLERLAQLAQWYRDSFESLDKGDRVEFLEQFMSLNEFDDRESLEFINKIDFESRAEIGIFIYRTLDGLKFIQAFQECWPAIDYDQRSEMVLFIIKKRPALLLMIAPFVKLSRWSKDGRYVLLPNWQHERSKPADSLQKERFSAYEKSSELIEGLLRYSENHPEENSSAVRDNLSNMNPALLIPYLDRIENLHILSKEQIKNIATAPQRFLPVDIFYTTEDLEEKKAIMKELEAYHPDEEERTALKYLYPTEITPLKLGVKLAKIENRALLRKTQALLSTFRDRQGKLGQDKLDYLFKLVEDGVPVFAQIDNLGLSKTELAALLNRCVEEEDFPFGVLLDLSDLKKFVEFSRRTESGSEADLEQSLIRQVIKNLQENGEYGRVGNAVALNAEGFFSIFRVSERQKIWDAVNKFAPALWLNNINYAIKHGIMTFDELITISSGDDQNFIKKYHRLLYHLHQLRREGKPVEASVESLAGKAKSLFSANPYLFLQADNSKIVKSIYSQAEQQQFITEQLTGNVNSYFFEALLSSEYINQYADVCRRLLAENGYLFAVVTEYSHIWERARRFVETKELIDLVIRHAESINFSTLFDDLYLIAELGKKPAKAAALAERLTELNNFSALARLNEGINRYGKEEQRLQKKLQSLPQLSYLNDEEKQKEGERLKKELAELVDNGYEANNRNLELLARETIEILIEACESNRFLVFDENILVTEGLDAAKYIIRDLPGYIAVNPEILFEVDTRPNRGESSMLCENILGEDKYHLLIRENARLLAFRKSEYGVAFDNKFVRPETLKRIEEMNPLIGLLAQSKTDLDYYSAVLRRVMETPLAGLYRKELEKIIKDKKEAGEPRLITGFFEADNDFEQPAKKIFLLNSHAAIRAHAGWLMSLPENQQTELVGLLEFSLLNGLVFLGKILQSEDFSEVKKELQGGIEEFVLYVFGLEDLPELSFDNLSVDSTRALMIYYYKSCKKDRYQELAFKDFIIHVLNGTYGFWRAWDSNIDPEDKLSQLNKLKEKKLIPEGLTLDQYRQWLDEEKFKFEETLAYDISDLKAGIGDIIGDAVADGHITEESLDLSGIDEKYNTLIEPLNIFTNRQRELRELSKTAGLTEERQAEYKELARQIADYRKKHETEMTAILALKYLSGLKNLTAHELENQVLILKNKNQVPLKKALSLLAEHFGEKSPDFIGDINRIRQLLAGGFEQIYGGKKVSRGKLYLTDRVDLETYVFIGERPVASCQNYDGRSGQNAGLLSYLSDPNVKIIQIYNESGGIIARSVMRLVEDDDNKPQLFIERTYSANPHPKINEAIVNFAKLKAEKMNVGLYASVSVGSNQGTAAADLHNNNSRSAYVYTDAAGGRIPKGRFTIRSAKLIR
ncbi:MAG: hypothetical protein WC668_00830 [Patescibacteria group bacterium]|jgi:hypothetical protein